MVDDDEGLSSSGVDCFYLLISVSLASNTILGYLRYQPHTTLYVVS